MPVRNRKLSSGFSMIELLVAMLVGLVIVSGAFSLHSTSRKTQMKNEEQMDMVADARFAIEMISYDLRHAGMWGGTNKDGLIECQSTDTACSASSAGETLATAVTGDCDVGWYYDLSQPVFGVADTDTATYTSCVKSRKAGTDMLAVRYADSNLPAALTAGQVYVRSNFINGRVFVGTKQPVLDAYDTAATTNNHELRANLYYVGDYSDSVGDGIPALRRAALAAGPKVDDQLLISGVQDFQVAFGEDVNGDGKIDRYVTSTNVVDWQNVYSAKIWLVMRSDKQLDSIAIAKDFWIDGAKKNYGKNYRYFMVSTVVDLRNLRQI